MKRKSSNPNRGAIVRQIYRTAASMIWVEDQARMWIGRRASAKRVEALRELSLRAGQLLRDYERLETKLCLES